MFTSLIIGPEILIILLNRGKGTQYNIKILFEEDLDLFNYIEMKNTGYKYKLIGVITHLGESGMSGHFIAYCRDPISSEWYQFNDSLVNKAVNFQSEVINLGMPLQSGNCKFYDYLTIKATTDGLSPSLGRWRQSDG